MKNKDETKKANVWVLFPYLLHELFFFYPMNPYSVLISMGSCNSTSKGAKNQSKTSPNHDEGNANRCPAIFCCEKLLRRALLTKKCVKKLTVPRIQCIFALCMFDQWTRVLKLERHLWSELLTAGLAASKKWPWLLGPMSKVINVYEITCFDCNAWNCQQINDTLVNNIGDMLQD